MAEIFECCHKFSSLIKIHSNVVTVSKINYRRNNAAFCCFSCLIVSRSLEVAIRIPFPNVSETFVHRDVVYSPTFGKVSGFVYSRILRKCREDYIRARHSDEVRSCSCTVFVVLGSSCCNTGATCSKKSNYTCVGVYCSNFFVVRLKFNISIGCFSQCRSCESFAENGFNFFCRENKVGVLAGVCNTAAIGYLDRRNSNIALGDIARETDFCCRACPCTGCSGYCITAFSCIVGIKPPSCCCVLVSDNNLGHITAFYCDSIA